MRPEEDAFIEKLYQDTFRLLWGVCYVKAQQSGFGSRGRSGRFP